MDDKSLDRIYKENLDEKIIAELARVKGITVRDAMDLYYQSKLSRQINNGAYGIENLDYRYLVSDLLENEKELFHIQHYIELKGEIIKAGQVKLFISFQNGQIVRSDYNAKLLKLILNLGYTNEYLKEFYHMHYSLISNQISVFENAYYTGKYYRQISSIIHDLKYTIDQLITLICLLRKESIYIDSIGELYNPKKNPNKVMQDIFTNYQNYLIELNDMENSFKHHFTNGIKEKISNYEPIIYYYYCRNYSNPDCAIEERDISVNYMMDNFNKLLDYIITVLFEMSKKG